MTISRTRAWRGMLALALTTTPLIAFPKMANPVDSSGKARLARAEAPMVQLDKADRQDRTDGVTVMSTTNDFVGLPGEPAATARAFISARATQLSLSRAQIAQLMKVAQRDETEFSVVRFEQAIDGVPVHGSDIAVTVAADGRVLYLASRILPHVGAVATKRWAVDREQALDRARAYLGATLLEAIAVRQVAFADNRGTRGAWEMKVVAYDHALAREWALLIDGDHGEVLRAEDRTLNARARGFVFHPDPLSPSRSTYGAEGLTDNSDRDSAQLAQAQVPAVFPVTTDNGQYRLAGPYAVCTDFEAPHDSACPDGRTPMLYFNRTHPSFEAVNAYYHLTNYLDYVTRKLGIRATPYQYAGGVQFDPHGLSGEDNSHYIPGNGRIAFGQGGVDDAEDADVIIHELGHGLHDWLTHGRLSNVEGLSEGLGDYLAAGYSRDMNQWQPGDAQYHWVMNWDGHNEYWRGRATNWHLGRTYPTDVWRTSIHDAGQYWASCNLVARDAIGGVAMDRAVLKGIAMTHAFSNQRAAAQAVVSAAVAMRYPQAHIDAIVHAYNTTCTYNVTVPQTI